MKEISNNLQEAVSVSEPQRLFYSLHNIKLHDFFDFEIKYVLVTLKIYLINLPVLLVMPSFEKNISHCKK